MTTWKKINGEWIREHFWFGSVKATDVETPADSDTKDKPSVGETAAEKAAKAIAEREQRLEAKVASLTSNRNNFRKAASDLLADFAEGASNFAVGFATNRIEKPIDVLLASLQEIVVRLANMPTVPTDADTRRREEYANLHRVACDLHPDYLLPTTDGNGSLLIVPVRRGLELSTKALVGALATTRGERIDDIVRKSRQGATQKKAFEEPAKFGGLFEGFEGGDEEFAILAAAHVLAFDRTGEIINMFRIAAKCADRANEARWDDAAEIFNVLTGALPVREKSDFRFPFDESSVSKLIQGRIYALHAFACSDWIKTLKDAEEKRLNIAALEGVENFTEHMKQRQGPQAEKPKDVKLESEPDNRTPEQVKIDSVKAEILSLQAKPSKEWDKAKMGKLVRSLAPLSPDFAAIEARSKLDKGEPEHLDRESFNRESFALGRALIGMESDWTFAQTETESA